MGMKRGARAGIHITQDKLSLLILEFLTTNAVHFKDYQPESEMWRQLLATRVAEYIISRTSPKTP